MLTKISLTIGFLLGVLATTIIPNGLAAQVEPKVQVKTEVKLVKVPVKLTSEDRRQIQCLAENTYFEAGNQPKTGKIAVNNVVMNRVNDPTGRFGKTPCSVVNQRTHRVCQFSWKCEGRKKIHDQDMFAESKKVAEQVYLGNYGDVTGGAKYYHATYVRPNWKHLARLTQIGAHIFYDG